MDDLIALDDALKLVERYARRTRLYMVLARAKASRELVKMEMLADKYSLVTAGQLRLQQDPAPE